MVAGVTLFGAPIIVREYVPGDEVWFVYREKDGPLLRVECKNTVLERLKIVAKIANLTGVNAP